ncbi:MAG: hypothetical protein ABI586_09170, partial [Candidatus Nanopelagicales bacterium]
MTNGVGSVRGAWKYELLAVLVVAAAVVVAFLLANRSESAPRADNDGASSATAEPSSSAPSLGPLSDDTIKELSNSGDTLVVLDPNQIKPEVDQDAAVTAASDGFGRSKGIYPSEVSLTKLTVSDYGKELSDDPSKSELDLYIKDRDTWIVVFPNVDVPISNGGIPLPGQQGSKAEPDTYTADMV